MGQQNAAMPFIMVAVLIDMLAVGLIMPALPAWVGAFATTPADQAFWYGVVAFSFGFANFFSAPLLGAMSDRWGRRPVLLTGIFGVAASLLLTGLSQALWVLLLARLLGGAMQANLAIANAYVADITPREQLAKQFGLLGAMMGIGFVIGPALGGLLGLIDLRLPFFVAAALALVNWLYGYFFLPESLAPERRVSFTWHGTGVLRSVGRMLNFVRGGQLLLAISMNALAQYSFNVAWVLYMQYRYGWGPRESGMSLGLIGIATLLVQGGLVGAANKRISTATLGQAAMFCAFMAYLVFGFASASWVVFPAMLLHAAGFASVAALQTVLAQSAGGSDQGRVFGAIASANALAAVLAPIAASTALRIIATLDSSEWRMGMPMFLCAAIQMIAFVVALDYFRGKRLA